MERSVGILPEGVAVRGILGGLDAHGVWVLVGEARAWGACASGGLGCFEVLDAAGVDDIEVGLVESELTVVQKGDEEGIFISIVPNRKGVPYMFLKEVENMVPAAVDTTSKREAGPTAPPGTPLEG